MDLGASHAAGHAVDRDRLHGAVCAAAGYFVEDRSPSACVRGLGHRAEL